MRWSMCESARTKKGGQSLSAHDEHDSMQTPGRIISLGTGAVYLGSASGCSSKGLHMHIVAKGTAIAVSPRQQFGQAACTGLVHKRATCELHLCLGFSILT